MINPIRGVKYHIIAIIIPSVTNVIAVTPRITNVIIEDLNGIFATHGIVSGITSNLEI